MLRAARGDIAAAGHVDTLRLEDGPAPELSVAVELAEA
jgi:hypothetical protein